MSIGTKYRHLLEEVDFLLAERRQTIVAGPHFIVIHGQHKPGTLCLHGETVEQACLVRNARSFPLHLSPTGLLIFDCLCRYRKSSLTASRLSATIQSDPFYADLTTPWRRARKKAVCPCRTSIKVHVQRIREQIASVLEEANLSLPAGKVLVSQRTDTNITVYRLRATVEFIHLDGLTKHTVGLRQSPLEKPNAMGLL